MCREYLCDCSQCLQFNFDNCSNHSDGIENTKVEEEIGDSIEIENYGQWLREEILAGRNFGGSQKWRNFAEFNLADHEKI